MIEVKNISKSFSDKTVLNNISAVFEKGKTNLIIGSSGTGKSVLLKCLVGLIKPDQGEVLYDNRNFIDKQNQKSIRRELGMLFQGSALFDSKTVEQNIMFPLDMMTNMTKKEKLDRVNFCLERVGLSGINSKMPSETSGGMQKRIGIARAIVMNPKYLYCDEPNSGLDPQTAIKIDDLISEITHEFDTTTIVVTHDMNSVINIGEKILYMKNGLNIWEGTNKTILETKNEDLKEFLFSNSLLKHLKES